MDAFFFSDDVRIRREGDLFYVDSKTCGEWLGFRRTVDVSPSRFSALAEAVYWACRIEAALNDGAAPSENYILRCAEDFFGSVPRVAPTPPAPVGAITAGYQRMPDDPEPDGDWVDRLKAGDWVRRGDDALQVESVDDNVVSFVQPSAARWGTKGYMRMAFEAWEACEAPAPTPPPPEPWWISVAGYLGYCASEAWEHDNGSARLAICERAVSLLETRTEMSARDSAGALAGVVTVSRAYCYGVHGSRDYAWTEILTLCRDPEVRALLEQLKAMGV